MDQWIEIWMGPKWEYEAEFSYVWTYLENTNAAKYIILCGFFYEHVAGIQKQNVKGG